MKNAKLGLLSFATILGIGSAYASKPSQFTGTTYFAVTNGTGFVWTATKPLSTVATCQGSAGDYCTIVTNGTWDPLAHPNTVPTPTQASLKTEGLYKNL